MLLTDFYTLKEINETDSGKYECLIYLNKEHDVFKGHFPNNPVTPGVCMIQIIKEIVSKLTESKLHIESVSNIKFMEIVNPFKTPEVLVNLEIKKESEIEHKYLVKNTWFIDKDTIALKMGAKFVSIE